MTSIQLNLFQQLIRQWEAAHPYNAAQVMRVVAEPSSGRAQAAWNRCLDSARMGKVLIENGYIRHEPLNGDQHRYPLQVLEAGACLTEHLSREINLDLSDPWHCPFRPFLLPGRAAFWFGVTYRHCIADSVSIRLLMRRWLLEYLGQAPIDLSPLGHAQAGYWRLFAPIDPHPTWNGIEAFRTFLRFRRSRKPRPADGDPAASRVLLRRVDAGLAARLKRASRNTAVRSSDLMLAALADAARVHVPFQHRRSRPDISVACIVDLRPHASLPVEDRFGLFLGFTSAMCRPADFNSFLALTRAVARQTALQRRRGVAAGSIAWMLCALTAGKWIEPSRLYDFCRKHAPFSAGLSSVSLDRSWIGDAHPTLISDYIRVSPTGPIAPAVMGVTRLGEHLSLALTYRPSVVSPDSATAMMDTFISRLSQV